MIRRKGAEAEQVIAALAQRQHGVVTRAQLMGAGIAADAIDRRLAAQRLRALHRGVYQVGPVRAPRALEMAAALACGADASVSHHSAAVLWQLLRPCGAGPQVIVPPGRPRRPAGVRVHRIALRRDEVTVLDGIPITTPARTLYDLARTGSRRDLERALAEALARGLATPPRLEASLAGRERQPGTARLRALLGSPGRPMLLRSRAEEAFLELISSARLPAPEANVVVSGHEVDFFWRAKRFVAEIDGFAFHSSRRRFEADRRRDAELTAAGLWVVRVTWNQIEHEPMAVVARLVEALTRAGGARFTSNG